MKMQLDSKIFLFILVLACTSCVGQHDNQAQADLSAAKTLLEEAENSVNREASLEYLMQASSFLTNAIESDNLEMSERTEALLLRATTYISLQKYDAAIQDLNAAIDFDPEVLANYFWRAIANQSLGNVHDAVVDLTHLINSSGQFPLAHGIRGEIMFELGKYQDAIDDLTIESENAPDDMRLIEMRGDAHAALAHYRQAVADYHSSIELIRTLTEDVLGEASSDSIGLEEARLRLKIGSIWERAGDIPKAISAYSGVLEHYPRNQEAQERLNALNE